MTSPALTRRMLLRQLRTSYAGYVNAFSRLFILGVSLLATPRLRSTRNLRPVHRLEIHPPRRSPDRLHQQMGNRLDPTYLECRRRPGRTEGPSGIPLRLLSRSRLVRIFTLKRETGMEKQARLHPLRGRLHRRATLLQRQIRRRAPRRLHGLLLRADLLSQARRPKRTPRPRR